MVPWTSLYPKADAKGELLIIAVAATMFPEIPLGVHLTSTDDLARILLVWLTFSTNDNQTIVVELVISLKAIKMCMASKFLM